MKKLVLALLGLALSGAEASAQAAGQAGASVAGVNFDALATATRDISHCWECRLIEIVYTYVFNFVYKMYGKLVPVILPLLYISMALWFVWYVWQNAVWKPKNSIDALGRDVVGKLLLFVFVLASLSLPPKEVFRWTIDPVMNWGTGLAKWILIETRNEADVIQDRKTPRYDCDDIRLDDKTIRTLSNRRAAAITQDEDEKARRDDEETLRNLMCITLEYSNTYTIGAQLGFTIIKEGVFGMASMFGFEMLWSNPVAEFLIASTGVWQYLIIALRFLLIAVGNVMNFLTIAIGGCIAVAFVYVAFVYLTAVLDIIVKLAMAGVMMPITIGSMLFKNVKAELFDKLFFIIIRCAFRISFLAVSISISTFLLNELMTMQFNIGGGKYANIYSIVDLVENHSVPERVGMGILSFALLPGINTFYILKIFLLNTGILVAILFITLIAFMLVSESLKFADTFADSIKGGMKEDTVLSGLKKLTISTIRYLSGGVKRDLIGYRRARALSDEVGKAKRRERYVESLIAPPTRPDRTTILHLPADYVIVKYKEQEDAKAAGLFRPPRGAPVVNPTAHPVPKALIEESEKATNKDTGDWFEYLRSKNRREGIIAKRLDKYAEYKKLSPKQRERVNDIIMSDAPDRAVREMKDKDIGALVAAMEKDTAAFPRAAPGGIPGGVPGGIPAPVPMPSPLRQVRQEVDADELAEEITGATPALSAADRREMAAAASSGRTESLRPELKRELERVKARLSSKTYKDRRNLEELKQRMEFRSNYAKYNNAEITAKDMMRVLTLEEISELRREIESIDELGEDRLKRFWLMRQLKKLEKKVEEIDDKDNFDLADEVEDAIDKRNKRKKRRAP